MENLTIYPEKDAYARAIDRLIHGTHTSGEKSWNAKLTENDIGKILELLNTGYTHKWISDRYNVSRENITRIKNGKVW